MAGTLDQNGYFHDDKGGAVWYVPQGMEPEQALQYWKDVSGANFNDTDTDSAPYSAAQVPIGSIQVTKDGKSQTVTGMTALSEALLAGWRPLLPNGQPAQAQRTNDGGWIVQSDKGWVPLNVLGGQGWLPGQQEALQQMGLGSPSVSGDTPSSSAGRQVRMPDGSIRNFTGITPDLDAALKAGGIPLDPQGRPMKVTPNVYGGYLLTDEDGDPLPLNVWLGQPWAPGQQQALENYIKAGWKPGEAALPPDKAPSTSGEDSIDPNLFGSLMESFQGGGPIRVRGADGKEQTFYAMEPALDAALKAGGKIVRPDGSLSTPRQFEGGWISDNKPLNVLLGQGYAPGQQEALQKAGLTPGYSGFVGPRFTEQFKGPRFNRTNPTDISVQLADGTKKTFSGLDESLNQALQNGGKIVRNDGSLAAPEQFNGGWIADNKPLNVWLGQGWTEGQRESLTQSGRTPVQDPTRSFVAPSIEQVRKTPGYQFTLTEAIKALERPFAATGIKTGAQMKALTDRAGEVADLTYDKAYNRAESEFDRDYGLYTDEYGRDLGEYQQRYGQHLNDYNQAASEYERNYNQFEGDQNKRFSRLFGLVTGVGMPTYNQLTSGGQAYATNAGNIGLASASNQAEAARNAAAVRAQGSVNRANSITGGINTGLSTLMQFNPQYRRTQQFSY